MRSFFFILFLCCQVRAQAQLSMAGIKLGDARAALKKVTLKVAADEGDMIRFVTGNGNDLSVTTRKGNVVYMENDWSHKEAGKQPLATGFVFGKTSLRQIRTTLGSNGFAHRQAAVVRTDKDLVEFNCYELSNTADQVTVFVTSVPLTETGRLTEQNIPDHVLLAAIIIARKDYLDEIWGGEKTYDPAYKKVTLQQ